MSIIVFSDLDETLFSSAWASYQGTQWPVSWNSEGTPTSFFTWKQKELFELLNTTCIIPVTGRRTESLARLNIRFNSYKIASHGAIVLDKDNQPIKDWIDSRSEIIHRNNWCARLERIYDKATSKAEASNEALRVRMILDQGIPCYICVKGAENPLKEFCTQLKADVSQEGVTIHHNKRNMAIMPTYTSKQSAVRYVKERLSVEFGDACYVGFGDSLSDLPFMSECDYQMVPRNSQVKLMYDDTPII